MSQPWEARMKIGFFVVFATALLAAGPSRAEPQPDVTGFWESDDSSGHAQAWFYFVEKFQVYEGRLVKAFPRPGVRNVPNCLKCTGDQKNAPMLGLVIVKGMKRDGLKYEDGNILDPRDGSIYHAQMELSEDGQESFGCAAISAYPCSARRRCGRGFPTIRWSAKTFPKILKPPA